MPDVNLTESRLTRTSAGTFRPGSRTSLTSTPVRRQRRIVRAVVPPDFCVISVGGVESGADVRERLAAGATLVQGYTAFLYRGPLWARQISRELARTGI